ncbi:gypsy type transposase [Tanacetum coccineum]
MIIKKLESIHRKFFWGGSSDVNKIAWVAWDKVIAPFSKGGLNIGILSVKTQPLWRVCDRYPFLINPPVSFVSDVLVLVEGMLVNQPIHSIPSRPISDCGPPIPDNGRYDPPRLRFRWAWNRDLRSVDYDELIQLQSLLCNLQVTSDQDKWECLIDSSRSFSVKVNIASCRIENHRIPTRVNLDSRGIDLHSTRCPICDDDLETEDHVLVKCDVALNIDGEKEVHPQLPGPDDTMHERPAGKVGMYTRFFDYANYRIPFSNFFVSVLIHFRIPFSQLSVFGSAKVSHFEILCRVCNIEPVVGLFRYFYTHNYKNGWFGFTKRPNVRACYSKNLDSVKNWNDHFFWVDEFVVPANAQFNWFSGLNISKDRAPAASEYNAEHASILITHASPFLRFPEEFLCWVGISRNYLLNKDTYPRFEYESGEEMDLNAFIRTADPRKVRIVERARAENERPIVTVAKHRTVTLLPTSVVRPSGELSASIEREFVGDAGGSGSGDQEIASVGGHDNVEPIVPTTENVVAEIEAPVPRRSKKKRVTRGSEGIPAASHPPKRLRADYGTTGGSAVGGKSPSVLNRLLQDYLLTVEQGVPALHTLPFITSSVTASPLEEGEDHTDSVTGPSLRTVCHSGDNYGHPVTAFVSSVAATATTSIEVGKDKDVPAPSVFSCSSSSDKTDRTLSLFTGKSGSEFVAGSIFVAGSLRCQEEMRTVVCAREFVHEQLFAEFNVSAARNLSLSSEVRMRAEYNILEKKKWKSLAEEKDNLLQREGLGGLWSVKFSRAMRSSLEVEVASAWSTTVFLSKSIVLEIKGGQASYLSSLKGRELSWTWELRFVHELETSSAGLREKLEMYEGSMRQLEEFQDSLMKPLEARLAEIDADFTRCCMHFQENFHSHLLNVIAGRRWLLTHGMKLIMAKYLNSTEYMEALGNAFGRAIEKGMQEGLAAGIEHGQAGRCLSDLEAYNPSAKADFNFVVRDLRGLDFLLLRDLSAKKDASTWDVMDLLRLDDVVAEVLGMTDLQPDVGQLMVLVHHKQDKVVIGSQALSVALETCHHRVRKMERNLVERLPLLKDTSTEPPVTALITMALSTVVIRPNSDPFLLVKDYENPDLAGVVPKDVIPRPKGEDKVEGSTKGDVDDVFSQFENESIDAVL